MQIKQQNTGRSKNKREYHTTGTYNRAFDHSRDLVNQSMKHIAVERNRRRQMNEHLKVLRSLTPCFYIKRGDQASIIGGVVEFIKELQQVLQTLESKKQRRNSLSPSPGAGPPCSTSSSTTTTTAAAAAPSPSPSASASARPRLLQLQKQQQQQQQQQQLTPRSQLQPETSTPFAFLDHNNDTVTMNNAFNKEVEQGGGCCCCNSPVADVEAKITGANVVLRTVSRRIPGQVVKIINVLEKLSFEILHLNISSMEDTVLYSFVIKIGLECQLSVEELALEVQQTFSSSSSDAVVLNKV